MASTTRLVPSLSKAGRQPLGSGEEWLAKADPRCSPSPWIPAHFPEQPRSFQDLWLGSGEGAICQPHTSSAQTISVSKVPG